jgi:hypothetical protein
MMGIGEMLDEHDLDYCPRCGEALEATRPVECPEHGPVSITYQEVPSDEEMMEMLFGGGEDGEAEGSLSAMDEVVEEIEAFVEEFEDSDDADGREENPREDVRDRLNRLLGRE